MTTVRQQQQQQWRTCDGMASTCRGWQGAACVRAPTHPRASALTLVLAPKDLVLVAPVLERALRVARAPPSAALGVERSQPVACEALAPRDLGHRAAVAVRVRACGWHVLVGGRVRGALLARAAALARPAIAPAAPLPLPPHPHPLLLRRRRTGAPAPAAAGSVARVVMFIATVASALHAVVAVERLATNAANAAVAPGSAVPSHAFAVSTHECARSARSPAVIAAVAAIEHTPCAQARLSPCPRAQRQPAGS